MKLQQLAHSYYINRIRALSLFSKKKAAAEAFELFCIPFNKVVYTPTEFLGTAAPLSLPLNGLNMKGYLWNKGGSKRILIAHGFRSSSANFTHIAKNLIAQGFEVLAFDAPAHGLSEGKKITGILYRDMIHQIIAKYGPVDGFVAHSFGCIATAFALAELPQTKNTRIVFIAPASDISSLSRMFFGQLKIKDREVQQHFLKIIEQTVHQPLEWFTIKRCMQTIEGSVLWIHDKGDNVTPVADALKVQQMRLHNIEFVFIHGLGHRKIYRDEEVVNKIVDFLRFE